MGASNWLLLILIVLMGLATLPKIVAILMPHILR